MAVFTASVHVSVLDGLQTLLMEMDMCFPGLAGVDSD